MASSRKSRTVTLEPSGDAESALQEATPESTGHLTDELLCPTCGDPQAWHEHPCSVPAATSTKPSVSAVGPDGFAYQVGQPVVPAGRQEAQRIVWRGQVKERRPETGWLHRVNVYRLDDGYWDCYHETELQAA